MAEVDEQVTPEAAASTSEAEAPEEGQATQRHSAEQDREALQRSYDEVRSYADRTSQEKAQYARDLEQARQEFNAMRAWQQGVAQQFQAPQQQQQPDYEELLLSNPAEAVRRIREEAVQEAVSQVMPVVNPLIAQADEMAARSALQGLQEEHGADTVRRYQNELAAIISEETRNGSGYFSDPDTRQRRLSAEIWRLKGLNPEQPRTESGQFAAAHTEGASVAQPSEPPTPKTPQFAPDAYGPRKGAAMQGLEFD